MPPPGPRMTKNEERNHRYRPGKAVVESDEDWDSDEAPAPIPAPLKPVARPAASTYIPKKLPPAPIAKPEIDLEGFVTASESEEEGDDEDNDSSEGSSEEESESDESESEEEVKPRLIAPKFISKAQRAKQTQPTKTEDQLAAEEEERRKEKTTEILQAQIERDQATRAAGKKAWDDDVEDDIDDTDDIDPEAESAAWKLRELKRVKRDRLALIEKEKEREEIDRRKNLTAEEREAEDKDFLEQQKAEQAGRGKMAFMQKYYHKGAFFQGDEQDEEVQAALNRDLAGARFVDESNKDVLPEYMRIRDMTQLGRKSRTRYKDLKSEDTGRFGDFGARRQHDGLDDRFREDHSSTGANAAPIGTRRTRDSDDSGHDQKRARYD